MTAIAASSSFAEVPWHRLPDLPRAVAGQFVGADRDRLIVAGGTYFDVPPWDGGKKTWTDQVLALAKGEQQWRRVATLPKPVAYGAAVSAAEGLLLIGGQTAEECSASVFLLKSEGGKWAWRRLPDLPAPAALVGAARIGETVYVAGGLASASATEGLHRFWSLKLASSGKKQTGWMELDPWPGAGRILPVVAAAGSDLYLFSGASLNKGATGAAVRTYLKDAFRYRPGSGWQKLADLARPVVAAPVIAAGPSRLLIFGGDDGELAARIFEIKDAHPGFSRSVLLFDATTGQTAQTAQLPFSLVTTAAAFLGGDVVIAGGEDRPGHRSAAVIAAPLAKLTK